MCTKPMRDQEPKVAVQSYSISRYGVSLLNEGNAIMQYQHLGKLEILMLQSLRFPKDFKYILPMDYKISSLL